MEPPEDRPESLPEQVTRLATGAWRRAYRTRGEWALWACVAAYVLLAAATIGIDAIPPPTSRAMWSFSLVWSLVYPAVTTGFLFAGLWAALSKGSLGSRMARSLGAALLVAVLMSPDNVLFPLLGVIYWWTLWFGVGLSLRAMRYGVFGRSEEAVPPARLRVADVLALTGVVAVYLGISEFAFDALRRRPGDDLAEQYAVINTLSYFGFAVSYVLALAPLLWAAFPVDTLRARRLAGCAISTYVLIKLVIVLRLVIDFVIRGLAIDGGQIVRSVTGYTLQPLGTIFGVIAAALFTRWAGYRLRRPANRPVAPAAAGR